MRGLDARVYLAYGRSLNIGWPGRGSVFIQVACLEAHAQGARDRAAAADVPAMFADEPILASAWWFGRDGVHPTREFVGRPAPIGESHATHQHPQALPAAVA